MTSVLDILSWPTQVVDALRKVLLNVNVQLPAVLAQLLVCVILLLIIRYLFVKKKTAESGQIKLAIYSVLFAAGVGVVSIVVVWVDHAIWPRYEQIVGKVSTSDTNVPSITLLDNLGNDLGATVNIDGQGAFFISINPTFADPPTTVQMQLSGCMTKYYNLQRSDLLGNQIQLNWRCDNG